ncbi:MAG: ribonuclease III [Clostridia bacterium]|nr:ribonuclease III [Clostridia bacterium]
MTTDTPLQTSLKAFMERLHYQFQDANLLRMALTHPSMGKAEDNQRLEFLGDAVLQLIITEQLYLTHPRDAEGDMTHYRALLVCETALSQVAHTLHLGDYLILDHGEEMTGGREKPSVLCDAMEAVLAAVYLDGGYPEAQKIVRTFWPRPEQVVRPMQDSKSLLQEHLQKDGGDPPEYEIISVSGPAHDPRYVAVARRGNRELGRGQGRSKKDAEKAAALDALKKLGALPKSSE